MAKRFFVNSTSHKKYNTETGEVEEIEYKKLVQIKAEPNENFYMIFFKYMSSVWELTHANDIKLIFKLCEMAKWETGEVSISSAGRAKICEDLKIHTTNLSKSLDRLKEKSLISGNRGEYMINPMVFWKGSKGSREELLRKDGISLTFNIKYADQ